MDKIPFSVYDFFGYLSSGVVWVITADYVLGTGLLNQRQIAPVLGIALIILAYVCGQIVALFSSFIFEQLVVGRLLGRPTSLLMGGVPRLRAFRWIFPNFFRPLPEQTRKRVQEQAEALGADGTGEALFLHAYPIVTGNNVIQGRLDDFRNQYGFARNMSFALIASALTIFAVHALAYHPVRLRWAALSAVGGMTLFYRYLKFFRQYTYELLVRYAELDRRGTRRASPEVT